MSLIFEHTLKNSQLIQIIIVYIGYNCVPIIRKTKKYILKIYWEDPKYLGIITPLV